MKKPRNAWFQSLLRNVTSQFGEDGLIEHSLNVIGTFDKWCVEFGAWDGVHFSNTHNLLNNHGYSGVLIETSPDRFQQLMNQYAGNSKVISLNKYVGFDPISGLDAILADTPIPKRFDLLSIDIDGNDYHVWAAVSLFRPKLVVIEFNPTIPNSVEFVQPADPRINQGCSLLSLCELGRSKGYELIASTRTNGFFVDQQYFPRFNLADNSIDALHTDDSLVTHIFCGYDGSIHLAGHSRLVWHEIPYDSQIIQHVPLLFRRFPGTFNSIKGAAWEYCRRYLVAVRRIRRLIGARINKITSRIRRS